MSGVKGLIHNNVYNYNAWDFLNENWLGFYYGLHVQ
jgi:hypothetical protein